MIIPSNPKLQYFSHKREIDEAIERVLNSGRYILGKEVELFEEEFAEALSERSKNYAVGVASGTDALKIALRACDITSGDEVITVSHTAVATATAIVEIGAEPVFIDIEPDNFTMNPNKIKEAISRKTKAIIPVHLYGNAANISEIIRIATQYNLIVIEDCAQAHLGKYESKVLGTFGGVSCFSFYPTKNLGAIGDGGMAVTNNIDIAKKMRLLREYGWEQRYISSYEGSNSRLDELQAAILRVKFKYLEKDNEKRRKLASLYNDYLSSTEINLPQVRKDAEHVFHLYVIRSALRDQLKKFLEKNDVITNIHYPVPIHLQPHFKKYKSINCIESELAATQVLSLPLYPELKKKEVEEVSLLIKRFLSGDC